MFLTRITGRSLVRAAYKASGRSVGVGSYACYNNFLSTQSKWETPTTSSTIDELYKRQSKKFTTTTDKPYSMVKDKEAAALDPDYDEDEEEEVTPDPRPILPPGRKVPRTPPTGPHPQNQHIEQVAHPYLDLVPTGESYIPNNFIRNAAFTVLLAAVGYIWYQISCHKEITSTAGYKLGVSIVENSAEVEQLVGYPVVVVDDSATGTRYNGCKMLYNFEIVGPKGMGTVEAITQYSKGHGQIVRLRVVTKDGIADLIDQEFVEKDEIANADNIISESESEIEAIA